MPLLPRPALNKNAGRDKDMNVNVNNIFLPLLTLLFIGLKLAGHIAWSWWWVLSPI